MGANTKSAIAALSIEQIRAIARQQNATLVEYAIVPDDDFKFRGKQRARESELLIWVVQPTGEVALRRVDLKHIWQHNLTLTDLVNASRCLDGGIYCKKQAIIIANLGKESNSRYIGLRKLHKFLIEPIADLLPKDPNAHVVFIPQESLFLVPFAALQNADSKYLIEQHTIITAPAIQVLDLTRKQKNRLDEQNRKPLQPLIIGNPIMPIVSQILGEPPEQLPNLAASEREAVEIAKLLKYKALIGAQATKAKVKQLLAQANVVHFATHGLLEYRSQKSSSSLEGLEVPGALALAPDDQDDGLLTANEIFDQHLVAELVVLSACDTGRGRITGDGVIGLSRAFISAGTPSLVVSLWVVPDASTAELMITFYQKLQTKLNKAQAP
ncbi:MAG: CHAT domain-containing protein [Mojavia pulchra JT2-VF2]|uniref:CHAT domain-containing protein n=1 Tax=Mojavia pulchra JT2-VF2 TaxID=287848 RepID=A0A951Q3J1_9NOST|nr:CHAT domain-containing protein [Mojavia pulchra JT2-VF2]